VIFIINNQRDAALNSLVYYSVRDYSTCFRCSLHPSSGVHKTIDVLTGTSHMSVRCRFKSVKRCPRSDTYLGRLLTDLNLHHTDTWLVPMSASTVLRPPDDGCRAHPKHVE